MFNFNNIKKTTQENASARAWYAFVEELEEVLRIKKMMSEVKNGEVPVLTVAGTIALKLAKHEIAPEKAKDFVSICVEHPDEAASFWASLPKVLDPSVQWYKQNNKLFSVERDAIISLCGKILSEEQANVLATAAHEANERLAQKAKETQDKIDRAKALFQ